MNNESQLVWLLKFCVWFWQTTINVRFSITGRLGKVECHYESIQVFIKFYKDSRPGDRGTISAKKCFKFFKPLEAKDKEKKENYQDWTISIQKAIEERVLGDQIRK
jgi:hypothetical protein